MARYNHIIDAAHDDTWLTVDKAALPWVNQSWAELTKKEMPPDYRDRKLYDKSQPFLLRQAAASVLGRRLSCPDEGLKGVEIDPEQNVLVCPYSHEVMINELFFEAARPNGVIYAPAGFNPQIVDTAKKFPHTVDAEQRLRVVSPSALSSDQSLKPDLVQMEQELRQYRESGELCAIYFTQPNHGVVEDYSYPELQETARIFAEQNVPIICDMTFDQLVSDYTPLPTLQVTTSAGESVSMYNKTYTVMSNVYGYSGSGPTGFGALISGDTDFLQEFGKKHLTFALQRETTHLARAVIEHTTSDYLQQNKRLLWLQQQKARGHLNKINSRLGGQELRALGNPEGLYTTIAFSPELLALNGIHSSRQLADRARNEVALKSFATEDFGIPQTGLSLNTFAPFVEGTLADLHRDTTQQELFSRLQYLMDEMVR